MKWSALKLLFISFVILTKPAQGAVYEVFKGEASNTESWIDSVGERPSANGPWVHILDESVSVNFSLAYINEPNHTAYNIEWIDGQATYTYPAECSRIPGSVGNDLNFTVSAKGNDIGMKESVVGDATALSGTLTYHKEPVNMYLSATQAFYRVPKFIDCPSGLGEFSATVTGFLNIQKWWDGGTPNWRRTTQSFTVYYRPQTTISAEFSPHTISMTGPVNTYIENSTDLVITTSGGTKVEIVWPDVNLLEYEQAGVWMKGHTQSVSVTDGANKINKRIRVRSSVAGSTAISVPVTMTLS